MIGTRSCTHKNCELDYMSFVGSGNGGPEILRCQIWDSEWEIRARNECRSVSSELWKVSFWIWASFFHVQQTKFLFIRRLNTFFPMMMSNQFSSAVQPVWRKRFCNAVIYANWPMLHSFYKYIFYVLLQNTSILFK